jgi:LCP family protein required for cell wall assembly
MSTIARGRHVRDPRHPLVSLLVRGLATGLAAVLVVTVTAGAVLVRRLDGNIQSADVEEFLGDDRPEESEENYESLTILLIGSDTRELEGEEDFGQVGGQRADTTIVLHLSADRDRAQLISIPRDSMVEMPDCFLEDGTVAEGGFRQFNAAFSTGGAACVQRTVEQTTGILIDHYAIVNFDGFKSIVDALGGVEVCTTEPINDPLSGLVLEPGTTTVAGDQALAYVRARNIGNGSDIDRIARQQAFLSSMVQEVTSTGLLARPDRLIGVLDAGTKSLTTDPGLNSVTALAGIARSVQALPAEDVSFLTIPNEPWPEDPNRVIWTDDADLVWDAIRNDAPLPGQEPEVVPSAAPSQTEAPEPLTVSPDAVLVDVINAGAPPGSAGAAAEDLATQGFEVGQVLNGEEDVSGVRVLVPAGQDEAARTLAAAFEGAELVRDAAVTTLTVQLGAGAGFVQEVPNRLGTVPLPERSAPPSATPSIEVRAADDDICG